MSKPLVPMRRGSFKGEIKERNKETERRRVMSR
jgi:hypothetical protein